MGCLLNVHEMLLLNLSFKENWNLETMGASSVDKSKKWRLFKEPFSLQNSWNGGFLWFYKGTDFGSFYEEPGKILCVIQKHQGLRSFEGFDAMEIRNYKRINEENIALLKRDNTTFVPRVYDQVFPETSGLVTHKSKIYVSKDNPQKTMRGVCSQSKNSTGTSLLPKVSRVY